MAVPGSFPRAADGGDAAKIVVGGRGDAPARVDLGERQAEAVVVGGVTLVSQRIALPQRVGVVAVIRAAAGLVGCAITRAGLARLVFANWLVQGELIRNQP